VSTSGEKPRGISPGEDAYSYDWPDDAKELRAAERAAARKRADVHPAPRYLTAYLVGTWTVLAFVAAFALVLQEPALLIGVTAPIAIVGLVAALPLGAILEILTRRFHQGISVLVFLVVGATVGYYWTFSMAGWILSHYNAPAEEAAASQEAVAVFMLTAVACAFVVARNTTDEVRMRPRPVYVALAVLVLLAIPSAIGAIQDFSAVGF
jgi:hypothetical protein